MRTRSQSCNPNLPQQKASPVTCEPLVSNTHFKIIPQEISCRVIELWLIMLEAPTEGYEDAIVVPEITANNFEIKHGLLNLVQNKQFFGHDKEDPHAHIRYFNKITSTMKFPNVPKMPRECLKIIESKSKVRQSRSKAVIAKVGTSSSTPAVSSDIAELKDLVRTLLLDKKNQAPAPVKAIEPSCVTCGGSGSLPGNTVTNPKEDLKGITTRSGVTTQGPTIPPTTSTSMNRDTEVTKDTMPPTNNESTKDVQPPFPYPWNISGLNTCNGLGPDLGATKQQSMPVFRWKDLSLSELTPTCMTLELADRSITTPIGIAKDVRVLVGKFQFPADFVVVEFEPDPRVPLILGRCFLKTSRALIDVYEGEITLRVGKEAITFNLDQTSRYTANFNHMTANRIDVIDMASEEYSQEVLGFSDSVAYGNPSPCFDPIVANFISDLTPFRKA
ncbi:reverse transcriptase domain-containing protein [Tanacetum coccineum]|uniref:Reverse transcriptase domain-containing protein n=1 Tax=Tanacetum coccineum TaxID=301880 RepID=A0ABQ5JAX7_9ASTR